MSLAFLKIINLIIRFQILQEKIKQVIINPCCFLTTFSSINQSKHNGALYVQVYDEVGARGGGTHDIFARGCATLWSLYRPFLEFLTKKIGPFSDFLWLMEVSKIRF